MSRSALDHLLTAVVRRQRVAEATALLARVALPSGLLIAAAAIVAHQRAGAPAGLAWLAALPVPLCLAWALLRPRSPRRAARRVDDHYGLDDRLGNALELRGAPPPADPQTADIIALIADEAESLAGGLDPRPVVSLRPPPLRALDLAAAACLIAALLVPPPAPEIAAADPATHAPPEAVREPPRPAADRQLLEPLREDLKALKEKDDEAARLAAAMLEVLDAYGRGDLDREAAFARLEALEQELADAEAAFEASLEEDPAILAEGMRELAAALEQEEITRAAGEELARGEGEKAASELDEAGDAAEREAAASESLDRALKAAEKALGKAASEASDTAAALAEAERRLKKQQEAQEKGGGSEEDERRLKKQQEKVEELRRQHEREKAAQRALDQLRRDAQGAQSQAGQKGQQKGQQGQQGGQRSQEQQRALERLSRGTAGASKTAQRQRRLGQARDDLEDAKTFLRRSGQGDKPGDKRQQQMERFGKAAKGKKGKKGKKGPTLLVEGDVGDGDPDMMIEGDGDSQGEGQGEGDGDSQGEGQGEGDAQGQGVGDGIGQGTESPLGDPSRMNVNLKNVRVDPRHGRGASRAEVIATASQEGFANESYRDVFTEYRAFAQSSLDREEVPAAQRRAVKRYFKLIQPRR